CSLGALRRLPSFPTRRSSDLDLGADLDLLLRGVDLAVRSLAAAELARVARCAALPVAVHQSLDLLVLLPLVPRDVPAVPVRPDHASWLEGLHSDHTRVDLRRRTVLALPDRPVGPRLKTDMKTHTTCSAARDERCSR